jgi:hypothetical protein
VVNFALRSFYTPLHTSVPFSQEAAWAPQPVSARYRSEIFEVLKIGLNAFAVFKFCVIILCQKKRKVSNLLHKLVSTVSSGFKRQRSRQGNKDLGRERNKSPPLKEKFRRCSHLGERLQVQIQFYRSTVS